MIDDVGYMMYDFFQRINDPQPPRGRSVQKHCQGINTRSKIATQKEQRPNKRKSGELRESTARSPFGGWG